MAARTAVSQGMVPSRRTLAASTLASHHMGRRPTVSSHLTVSGHPTASRHPVASRGTRGAHRRAGRRPASHHMASHHMARRGTASRSTVRRGTVRPSTVRPRTARLTGSRGITGPFFLTRPGGSRRRIRTRARVAGGQSRGRSLPSAASPLPSPRSGRRTRGDPGSSRRNRRSRLPTGSTPSGGAPSRRDRSFPRRSATPRRRRWTTTPRCRSRRTGSASRSRPVAPRRRTRTRWPCSTATAARPCCGPLTSMRPTAS